MNPSACFFVDIEAYPRKWIATMDIRVALAIRMMSKVTNDGLSIDRLSRRLNLSPGRLRQLFKKETGRSPKQFIKKLRMQRAEELLRTTFFSVKEVTFLSGMNDVSHFVHDFKKEHGLTPSKFRQLHQRSVTM